MGSNITAQNMESNMLKVALKTAFVLATAAIIMWLAFQLLLATLGI
jgi:hypothetical protein